MTGHSGKINFYSERSGVSVEEDPQSIKTKIKVYEEEDLVGSESVFV